jgi:hypothetical protein
LIENWQLLIIEVVLWLLLAIIKQSLVVIRPSLVILLLLLVILLLLLVVIKFETRIKQAVLIVNTLRVKDIALDIIINRLLFCFEICFSLKNQSIFIINLDKLMNFWLFIILFLCFELSSNHFINYCYLFTFSRYFLFFYSL